MPELSDVLAYGGPGTAMPGPVVGALVPFVLGPFTTATTVVSGAGELGFRVPCDMRIESISWCFETAPGAASTLAVSNNTSLAVGGTAILAATACTATGSVEGAGFISSAVRNVVKGRFLVFDMVIGTSAPVNMTITVMAYITGHAVADVTAR